MSLFAISDLHLSLGTDKPMDVFGEKWENYEEKLKENWIKNVKSGDTVIIGGDTSWATYLKDLYPDFNFINSLPGKKILVKGNHDYWWTTKSKMDSYCSDNGFNTIDFLNNNHYMYEDIAICGTRGWAITTNTDDRKIYNRELERLTLSLDSCKKSNPKSILAILHYPPDVRFRELLVKYRVETCVFGHLHGKAQKNVINCTIDGIKYYFISCEFLQFSPLKVF